MQSDNKESKLKFHNTNNMKSGKYANGIVFKMQTSDIKYTLFLKEWSCLHTIFHYAGKTLYF